MKKYQIIIIFLLIETIAVILLKLNYNYKKENILNSNSELITSQYETINNSFDTLANTVFKGYIDIPKIKQAFEKRDRKKLYELLKEDYKYLEAIDFKQIHFHLPTNHSFLRMHKPDKHSDDLTGIRYSLEYVNNTQKPITGLEMGRIVPGFRYVFPVFNGKNYLGSVETSFSVNAFVKKLENTFNVHSHFLLDKNVFENKIFDDFKKFFEESIESNNYFYFKRSNHEDMKKFESYIEKTYKTNLKKIVKEGIKSNKTFSFHLKLDTPYKTIDKIITFLVLKNIENKKIGYFVAYKNDTSLSTLKSQFYRNILIFTFIFILLLIFTLNELSKKDKLKEKVEDKTKELKKLNESLEIRIKQEVQKSLYHEKKLYEYERIGQIGEMLGNIAHQWRQPLTTISLASSNLKLFSQLDTLSKEEVEKQTDIILEHTTFLSNTIDTFRDFTKESNVKKEVSIQELIKDTLNIISPALKTHNIEIFNTTDQYKTIKKELVPNHLIQALISVINNSKEALIKNEIKNPWIKISLLGDRKSFSIIILDNAKGIDENIKSKIFDPYFTTKHKAQGVGLGLYLTRKSIVTQLKGNIFAKNTDEGAMFFIEIPY